MQTGEIWFIENDLDDQEAIKLVWGRMNYPNTLVFFQEAQTFIQALEDATTAPFIIICDVRLDDMDGFTLRSKMLAKHTKKFSSVPFIFWSTVSSEEQITQAYQLSIHGFFFKDDNVQDMKTTMDIIISYWMKSKMPGKRDYLQSA